MIAATGILDHSKTNSLIQTKTEKKHMIKSICVYCGSRMGNKPSYAKLAKEMGEIMAKQEIDLVYGGGSIGLMGVVADSVIDNGGKVFGYIPEHLDDLEVSYGRATEMTVVPNMHVRKFSMFADADAFLVLPGGFGSLDEFFEIITWAQLGLHNKPIILLNHENYWQPLINLIDHVINEGFANEATAGLLTIVDDVNGVLPMVQKLYTNKPPKSPILPI